MSSGLVFTADSSRPTIKYPPFFSLLFLLYRMCFVLFGESGCENCPFFKIDEDHERVVDCSTPNFTGNGMGPCSFSSSCKEKHRQLEQGNGGKFVPGCYTLAVSEELSEDMQNICEDKRIPYIRPKRA